MNKAIEMQDDKIKSLQEQKPSKKQEKLINQYVYSNMLNTTLE